MSDVINHPVLVVVSTSERADRCFARLLCVRAYTCVREEWGKGEVRRERPPRSAVEISISIIESRSIARTPRGAKHVPRLRAPGFFPPPFGAYYHLYSYGCEESWSYGVIHARVLPVYLIAGCDNCEAKESSNRNNCVFNWRIVCSIRDNSS